MSALKVSAEDPDSVADRVINRLVYGFHPYGMPGAGTAESLAGLTRQELDAYVAAHPEKKAALFSPYTVVRRQGAEHAGVQ